MAPPINLRLIERNQPTREKNKRIYLLCEGTLTEPSFLHAILTNSDYFMDVDNVNFYSTIRDGREFGINRIDGMIRIAYDNIIDNPLKFSKKKDKVIIFFDLDIYHDSYDTIKNLIEEHQKYIIFVFTNPAIELFLLLCKEDSYETIIAPHKNAILANRFSDSGRRYIHQLVNNTFKKDPKKRTTNFEIFAKNLGIAIKQEKDYIPQVLVDPTKNLISNFGKVLEKIKNNDIDNIDYFPCEDN